MSPALVPPVGLFLIVVGSIDAGLATPTEGRLARDHGRPRPGGLARLRPGMVRGRVGDPARDRHDHATAFDLFVIQSVRGKGSFSDVVVGSSPFVLVLVLIVALLVVFPGLALWLPDVVAAAR